MSDNEEIEASEIAGDVLVGIVACGVLAGDADGTVKPEEVDALVEIVGNFLEGLGWEGTPEEIHEATTHVAQDVSNLGAAKVLAGVADLLTDDEQRRIGAMVAAAVICVDGEVERVEARTYGKICAALGFSDDEAQEIWDEVTSEEEEEGE